MQNCTRFVTRWALTKGILEVEGHEDEGLFFFKKCGLSWTCVLLKEAPETFEEAAKISKDMARRKVDLLKKQVGKYEQFEPKVSWLEKKA